MPTLDWLKKEFHYGYRSGDILSLFPYRQRRVEERIIGVSYKTVFKKGVQPYLNRDSHVLELGPGAGSWSRAILKYVPEGRLTVLDFQDVRSWLVPEQYNNRLECICVDDNSFEAVADSGFDFFWSFGVLCHNNAESISEILANSLPRMKKGGYAVHQYGDWDKLEKWGWTKGKVPVEVCNQPDDEIWWPRKNQKTMREIATKAGWEIITPDLELVERDSIFV